MTMAGAKPINWYALTGEWAPYWASPERALVSNIDSHRGGTSAAVVTDWIMAQVTAGVVKLPQILADPVPAGSR